jgi:hypothetical protein
VLLQIEKLSPAARTAYDQLNVLKKQEHDITAKLSHNVLEELKTLDKK